MKKECNMKKVQHEKSATRKKCNLEIAKKEKRATRKKCNLKEMQHDERATRIFPRKFLKSRSVKITSL